MTKKVEKWRDLSQTEREKFYLMIERELRARSELGIEKYNKQDGHPTFKGNPIEHNQQELLDALFYNYYTRRWVDELLAPWPKHISMSFYCDKCHLALIPGSAGVQEAYNIVQEHLHEEARA